MGIFSHKQHKPVDDNTISMHQMMWGFTGEKPHSYS